MSKRSKKKNPKLRFASNMPPLYHMLPGEEYHHSKSEVLKWLSDRPMLISYIFDRAANANEIIYNIETGKWQGVDWSDEE